MKKILLFLFSTFSTIGFAQTARSLSDINLCMGNETRLVSPILGTAYSWSPDYALSDKNVSNPIAKPLKTTKYFLTVKDNSGKIWKDSLTINVAGTPVSLSLNVRDTILCGGASISVNAISDKAQNFVWSDSSKGKTIQINKKGIYIIQASNGFCTAHDTVRVKESDFPFVNFSKNIIICEDENYILNAKNPDASYKWYFSKDQNNKEKYAIGTSESYTVNKTGVYTVIVENKCGNYSESVFVKIDSCYQVYIPNIFSPNNDGTNDHFTVFDDDGSGTSLKNGDIVNINQLTIYDRWGEMLFQKNNFLPNDPSQGWDGTFRSKQMKQGDYVYTLSLMFKNKRETIKKGVVTLIR